MNESSNQLDADVYWAQVPEWVIVANISDRAVRLYALLARRANAENVAFPSRAYLAQSMNCSLKSVDRALGELLAIGAVTRQSQFVDSRQTVNLYTVRAMAGSPVTREGDTGDAPEGDTGDAQKQSHRKQSHRTSSAKKDELFEAIAEACGIRLDALTRSARGQLNAACKELRDIGATPEQVAGKAKAYRKRYDGAALTPSALTKHWASLEDAAEAKRKSIWETYERPEWY